MLHFLVGGRFERFGHVDGAGGARQLGEIAVLDVGHGLTGKGGFEVVDGNGFDGAGHGVAPVCG